MLRLWPLVALYSLLVACSGSEDLPPVPATAPAETNGDEPAPTPTLEVVQLGFSLQALHLADRVSTIAYGYEVLSGKVTGVALPFDPRIGYGGVPPVTSRPGDPKDFHPSQEDIDRPPGRDYTVYSVEVIDPGTSGLAAGDVINLRQSGGTFEGKRYQYPGEPPLEIGASYILPLIPAEITILGEGYSIGPVFAVFRIEDGSVKPLDSTWADLPAVQELTGKAPQDALSTIIAAREAAPSPPFSD
jgi:hypothetical protein